MVCDFCSKTIPVWSTGYKMDGHVACKECWSKAPERRGRPIHASRDGGETSPERSAPDYRREVLTTALGAGLGGIIGFLVRPPVPLVGKLPFEVVITRGSTLEGMDRMLVSSAQTSFNYILVGLLLGGVVGFAFSVFHAKSRPISSAETPGSPDESREERECPWCAESILVKARLCKHCGREVEIGPAGGGV